MAVVRYLFILLFLSVLCSESFAKKASIVEVDTFGSDPYEKLSNIGQYVIATGYNSIKGTKGSTVIDLLKLSDGELTFVESIDFNRLVTERDQLVVNDVIAYNDVFVFLVSTASSGILLVADIKDGKFNKREVAEFDYFSQYSEIFLGSENNLYIVDSNKVESISLRHFQLSNEYKVEQVSHRFFGVLPSIPVSRNRLTTTYGDNTLIFIANEEGGKATFYQVGITENGELEKEKKLDFFDAKGEYLTVGLRDGVLYMGTPRAGFQVAELTNEKVNVLQYFPELRVEGLGFMNDERLLTYQYRNATLFDIALPDEVSELTAFRADGTIQDFVHHQGSLLISSHTGGLQVFNEEESGAFSLAHEYQNSGIVRDFAIKGDTLVSSTEGKALNVWKIKESHTEAVTSFVHDDSVIQAVEFVGEDLLVLNFLDIIRYSMSDILQGVNSGEVVGSTNLLAHSQIIEMENGYVLNQGAGLAFFDKELNQKSLIELDDPLFARGGILEPLPYKNLLFLRTTVPNNPQIVVYDVNDLSDIAELNRFDISGSSITANMVIKDDILFVKEYVSNTAQISMYDISNTSDIKLVSQIDFNDEEFYYPTASLRIYGDFLSVVGTSALLYDISNTSSPVLIDQNENLTSNSISIAQDKNIFTVAKGSVGFIQRFMINLAPTQDALVLMLEEDSYKESVLTGHDDEGDGVSYDIVTEPSNGILEIIDAHNLKYTPFTDANGTDIAVLSAMDIHGNLTEFNVTFEISPINDAPVVRVINNTVIPNGSVSKNIGATDVDGDVLTYSLVEDVTNGSLTLLESGDYSYRANSGFSGTDVFTFEVSDGIETVQGTVSFNVQSAPPPAQKNSESSGGGSMGVMMLLLSLFAFRYRQLKN